MYNDLPETDRAVVESLCARFRQGLQSNNGTTIEELLDSVPDPLQQTVFRALLAEELVQQHATGEVPSADQYTERFPSQADLVSDVYDQVLSGTSETYVSTPGTDQNVDATMALSPGAVDGAPSTDQAVDATMSVSPSAVDETLPPAAASGSRPATGSGSRHETMALLSSQSVVPAVEHGKSYRVESEIDRGGMGVVLKVHDVQLQRILAMKLILGQEDLSNKSTRTPSADKLARFIREAEITGRLDHPGVVPVHEMARDKEGRLYFTMKFVQGKTLGKVLEELKKGKGHWTQARVLEILIRVCDTIAFAHNKGVIHRDLKPANIMVGEFGETYVMDWGLAKLMNDAEEAPDQGQPVPSAVASQENAAATMANSGTIRGSAASSQSATMDGSVLGTPQFMPPEQATGRVTELDERADIYSIGALLYRVLTDCNPYHDYKSASAVVMAVSAGPPKAITELTNKAPAELVAITEKAMQRDKNDRYATVSAMADDLRAFLDNRVVGAYRTGLRAKIEKWVVRNRSILATAVLIMFVGLSSIAYLEFQNSREMSEKNTELGIRGEELSRRGEELAKRKAELEIALEQQSIASQKEQEANDRLWGRKLVFDATRAIESSGATLASLLAIEAVDQYGYVGEESQTALYRIAEHLNEGLIFRGHRTNVASVAVSSDGNRAVSVAKDGIGIIWDMESGEELAMLFSKSNAFHGVAYIMDGKWILAWSRTGTVGVFDPATGARLRSWDLGNRDEENARPMLDVALYPDQQRFVAANQAGQVFVVDANQAEPIATFTSSDENVDQIERVSVSPNGTRIAAGCRNGRILLWNAETFELINTSGADVSKNGVARSIHSLSFNSDGSLFVSLTHSDDGNSGQLAKVWDGNSGKLRSQIDVGNGIAAALFHPVHKNWVVVGVDGVDSKIGLWEVDQAELIAESPSQSGVARYIRFSPVGDRFLTIAGKASLSVWELVTDETGQPSIQYTDSFVGHDKELEVNNASFDADGSRIVSASRDTSVRIWNVDNKRAVPMLGRHGRPYTLRISPAGDRILTLAPDWKVGHLWSYPQGAHVAELALGSPLTKWQFSPDGKLIFSGTKGEECRIWDAATGSLQYTIPDAGEVYGFGFDAAEQRLCVRSRKSTSVWNLADLSCQHEFNTEKVLPLLSTDGKTIFIQDYKNQTLKRFDPKTGQTKLMESASVMSGRYSTDESLFWFKGEPVDYGSSSSFIVHVLEADTGDVKHTFEDESGKTRLIKHADFSPDGSKILIEHYRNPSLADAADAFSIRSLRDGKEICRLGEYDSHFVGGTDDFSRVILRSSTETRMYDGQTGSELRVFTPTFGSYTYANYSPDGAFFLLQEKENRNDPSAEQQGQVSIREAQTGDLIAFLPGSLQMQGILSDSQGIVTVSSDRKVQLWPVDILGKCQSLVARSLTPAEQIDYLGMSLAAADVDQRLEEWRELKRRLRFLNPVTPERRNPARKTIEQVRAWLGEDPAEDDLSTAIESVQSLIGEPFDTDPNLLDEVASLYELQGDGMTVIKLLEQAVRHPRSTSDQTSRLMEARKRIAPVLVSYASAAALAEQQLNSKTSNAEYLAAKAWARDNNPEIAIYLAARELDAAEKPQQASKLLAPLVADEPLAPEPYLLQAKCLRQTNRPAEAVNVLRQALELEQCKSPEVWKRWLQIAFADLGRTPAELLSQCPPAAGQIRADEPFGNNVRWLLTRLNDSEPLRINSGGGDYRFKEGQIWSKDRFFTHGYGFYENNGEAQLFAGAIANTDHPALYKSERWFRAERKDLPAGYQIPLPKGEYQVTLGFAEIYAEDRSFDVTVENEYALRSYDPSNGDWATADEATIVVDVTDGQLNIEFRSNNNTNPKISTVQVIPITVE